MEFSREFASLFYFVSLFTCFDHFIGVFDYSVGRCCFDVIMDSDEELFLTQNCFEQEVLEPNFIMGLYYR